MNKYQVTFHYGDELIVHLVNTLPVVWNILQIPDTFNAREQAQATITRELEETGVSEFGWYTIETLDKEAIMNQICTKAIKAMYESIVQKGTRESDQVFLASADVLTRTQLIWLENEPDLEHECFVQAIDDATDYYKSKGFNLDYQEEMTSWDKVETFPIELSEETLNDLLESPANMYVDVLTRESGKPYIYGACGCGMVYDLDPITFRLEYYHDGVGIVSDVKLSGKSEWQTLLQSHKDCEELE